MNIISVNTVTIAFPASSFRNISSFLCPSAAQAMPWLAASSARAHLLLPELESGQSQVQRERREEPRTSSLSLCCFFALPFCFPEGLSSFFLFVPFCGCLES